LAQKLPSAGTPRTIRKGDQVDFDLQWLLLALPITFGLGWLASRFDWRQMQRDGQRSPKAYFKGLTHLLNEQPDQAIDAFIEVVQNDPDTSELHFALGNLFRKRGEFERAVRVHQHLLARSDLKIEDRERAQYALAQDYVKAGLFDRAEEAFAPLMETGSYRSEALLAMLHLHERARDWPAASQVARQLESAGAGDFAARRAHHACEMFEDARAKGDLQAAAVALDDARHAAPFHLRVQTLTAQSLQSQGLAQEALAQWDQLLRAHPQAAGLFAADYLAAAKACAESSRARQVLRDSYRQTPHVGVLQVLIADAGASSDQATTALGDMSYEALLQQVPNVQTAWAVVRHRPAGFPAGMLQALEQRVASAGGFCCAACGFESRRHFWQCPGCLSWDTISAVPVDGA
jgi:lipopolysaccharide assembly protein B